MSEPIPAKGLWDCHNCGRGGVVFGIVAVQPSTVDGPGEAEFYAEKEESGLYFAGCIYCGSKDVTFDDVRSLERCP